MGRSRGGLTSKIHAVVDTNGLPLHLMLTPGEPHDNRLCSVLLSALLPLADRGIRRGLDQGACPPARSLGGHSSETKSQRPDLLQQYLYRARNSIERFFNKIKQFRRVATRYPNSRLAIWRSSNSHQSDFGCCHDPRPNGAPAAEKEDVGVRAHGSVPGRGVISGGIGGGKARRSAGGVGVVTAAGGLGWSCWTSH